MANLKGISNTFQIIWITNLRLAVCSINLRILSKEIMFPFSEILVKGIISFFRYGIFFDLICILYFFVNWIGIKIINEDNHTILDTIEIEWSHILFHLSDNITFFIFKCESYIIRLRSISFLNILFKSENSWIRINSKLRNFERWKIMLKINFNHSF